MLLTVVFVHSYRSAIWPTLDQSLSAKRHHRLNPRGVGGAELSAVRVADLTINDGIAEYTPTPAFSGLSVNYNGMTTEQSNEAAKVEAEPKMEPVKIPPTTTTTKATTKKKTTVINKIVKNVNTGDWSHIVLWSVILVASAAAMIIIRLRRNEENKED